MNVPAIAKSTFELLRNQSEFLKITETMILHLNKIKNSLERARFLHNVVDEYNNKIFSHPIVKELMPCKSGCSGCCHTQVSVTEDEAELLAHNISNGVEIDYNSLEKQAKAGNEASAFFAIPYNERRCVFLDDKGACKVYKDRPSVCRTNAVIGDAAQCDTSSNASGGALRLVKTQEADMAIVGAYAVASNSGTLPVMLFSILKAKNTKENVSNLKKSFGRITNKKPISKDHGI
jgi:Fe-S-cluster containining protein